MSSKSLSDLNEEMQLKAEEHVRLCAESGVELLIYCTLRSNEEQDSLYASGRTVAGNIVTNARAGQSAHNPDADGKSSAYDCCPMISGKPVWDTKNPLWAVVVAKGEEAGLLASARWQGKLKESAHFQDPRWKKP